MIFKDIKSNKEALSICWELEKELVRLKDSVYNDISKLDFDLIKEVQKNIWNVHKFIQQKVYKYI